MKFAIVREKPRRAQPTLATLPLTSSLALTTRVKVSNHYKGEVFTRINYWYIFSLTMLWVMIVRVIIEFEGSFNLFCFRERKALRREEETVRPVFRILRQTRPRATNGGTGVARASTWNVGKGVDRNVALPWCFASKPPEIQPKDGPVPDPPGPRPILQDARAIHRAGGHYHLLWGSWDVVERPS